MTISAGDTLPGATLLELGAEGPQTVDLAAKLKGRKVVIFGLPGAYTRTCSSAHLPSFMRTKGQLEAKGVDEIICVSVNDPFVMGAWGQATGATAAGITMLADAEGAFANAIGLSFSAPPVSMAKSRPAKTGRSPRTQARSCPTKRSMLLPPPLPPLSELPRPYRNAAQKRTRQLWRRRPRKRTAEQSKWTTRPRSPARLPVRGPEALGGDCLWL